MGFSPFVNASGKAASRGGFRANRRMRLVLSGGSGRGPFAPTLANRSANALQERDERAASRADKVLLLTRDRTVPKGDEDVRRRGVRESR